MHVLGRINSEIDLRIHYCLTIARHGHPGEEASLIEIGDVDAQAHVPAEFGHTELTLLEGSNLDAHLQVSWAGGQIECDLYAGKLASPPRRPRRASTTRH